MNASAYWIRIGGYPATEIAAHTAPTWETLADGGCGSASWSFALSPRSQHQALQVGAKVEIFCGPVPVYAGYLTEFDRIEGTCHAQGLSAMLRTFLALDAGAAATRNIGTAVATAITDGWYGRNPTPVTGTPAGDSDGNPSKAGDLLDEYAEQTGQRWGVHGSGVLYMTPDPTAPTWLASPDAAAFGVTNESVVGRLAGRYEDSTTGLFATAYAGDPGPADAVDLTGRGAMTNTAAVAVLAGMLQRQGDVQWVNGATLHREQIQTLGGSPAFLPSVRAGQMVRAFGLNYALTAGKLMLDAVIGKTTYTAGEDVIQIEPVNTAPRNFVDVTAAS